MLAPRVLVLLAWHLLAGSQAAPANQEAESVKREKPNVYFLHIESHIKYRYAVTKVTSKVANPSNKSQEVQFKMLLPDTAFITSFKMLIDGEEYKAYVKEKDGAKKDYETAVESGQSAGIIEARDIHLFLVSVNVEGLSKVEFELMYEELLERTLGLYNFVINLNPGQIVRDFKVDVLIVESANIDKLKVPELHSANEIMYDENAKDNKLAEIKFHKKNKAHVRFSPTPEQQMEMMEGNATLWTRRFSVLYDIDRSNTPGGQILVNDGYFVHFFSPSELKPLSKYVVFVLDVSGSMDGRKLAQLKEAMATILDDLSPKDYFNLMEFSFSVTVHDLDSVTGSLVVAPDSNLRSLDHPPGPTAYPANDHYKQRAKHVINKMSSLGGTNIYDALKNSVLVAKTGMEWLRGNNTEPIEPIIIFLTDGEPTVGITSHKKILNMLQDVNNNRYSIFSFGFGEGADMSFLKKISLANAGFARTIYEAADAALQLNNFYKQVASPLLSNVTFTYLPGQVHEKSVTKKSFQSLFSGSEIVVAGRMDTSENEITANVDATAIDGPTIFQPLVLRGIPDDESQIEYKDKVEGEGDGEKKVDKGKNKQKLFSLERLWAYLTIKQMSDAYDLIKETKRTDQNDQAETLKKMIINLALKYKFVTPLTSMVVVKPNGTLEIDSASNQRQPTLEDKLGSGIQTSLNTGANAEESLYVLTGLSPHNKIFIERFDDNNHEDYMESETEKDRNEDIAWLPEKLQQNNTILIPTGEFNNTVQQYIAINPSQDAYQECQVNGVVGFCVHLFRCVRPEFSQSFDDFLTYFCPIPGRYVGVCCEAYNETETEENSSLSLLGSKLLVG